MWSSQVFKNEDFDVELQDPFISQIVQATPVITGHQDKYVKSRTLYCFPLITLVVDKVLATLPFGDISEQTGI